MSAVGKVDFVIIKFKASSKLTNFRLSTRKRSKRVKLTTLRHRRKKPPQLKTFKEESEVSWRENKSSKCAKRR
jgi:hypothetical protein